MQMSAVLGVIGGIFGLIIFYMFFDAIDTSGWNQNVATLIKTLVPLALGIAIVWSVLKLLRD